MFLIPLSSLSRQFHSFVTRGKYEFLNIEFYIYINRHNFRNVLIYNVFKLDATLYLNVLFLPLVVAIGNLILTLRSTTKQTERRSLQPKIQLCFYGTSWCAESYGAVGFLITAKENTVILVQTSIFLYQKCPQTGIELGI